MKYISHGYSEYLHVSTKEDINRILHLNCDGIEIDISRAVDGNIVVGHPPLDMATKYVLFKEALDLLVTSSKELFLEIKDPSVIEDIVSIIRERQIEDRVVIFGFPKIARHLPWGAREKLRLGAIAMFPWQIETYVNNYNPDFMFSGWGSDLEKYTYYLERFLYKILWKICAVPSIIKKYPRVRFVIGSLRTKQEVAWIHSYDESYGAIVDISLLKKKSGDVEM